MTERQIFEGALEFTTAADRQAFLDKACGSDAALRASVEALLASHDGASQFLNVPAVDQLRGESEKALEQTIDRSIDKGDNDEANGPDLSFLQPSTKPGSIGSLGHYEILQVLGQGAFGVVFRAFDEKLHRQVAVKAMNPQLAATSPPRKRFLREARSVAAIKHENIVQIYSVEEQPLPYLVMEFVQGQTLQQKLEGHGPLDAPEVLHLGRQMAAGLAAAHALGMIHRDIKPGNILLEQGADQKVKITDFGLARAADDASMTRTGVIAGTPLYMSPEQAEGRTLDARSDLFSLGSVLYQMCTGRPPFRAPNTIAVLRRVVEDQPRAMQEIIADTPPWLEAIVFKLLEKDPENRFQSAKEVADLFARCQSELQLYGRVTCVASATSRPVSQLHEKATPVAEAKPSLRPNRWLVAAPALIMVLLLTLYLINRTVDRFYSPTAVSAPEGNGNPTQVAVPGAAIQKFTNGEWIDVIPLIEPEKDKWNVAKQTGKNAWRIEQGELVVGGDALSSKLLLPLDSDWPAYEFEVEFTRRAGENGLNINLPTSNGECPVVVDPPGFACVHLGNQQRGAKLQVGKQISTNQRTTVRIEVHRAPNNNDRVSVALHRSTPWDWTGDLNSLALPYRENFPQDRRISLFVHRGGEFVFHRIRVKMLGGGVATSLRPLQTLASSNVAATGWHGWPADAPKPAIAPFTTEQAKNYQQAWADYLKVPVEWENSIGMKFRLVPPGEFLMGSTAAEIESALQETHPNDKPLQETIKSEAPQHKVVLTQPIYLGITEVTQAAYERVMGVNPSHFSRMGSGKESVAGMATTNHPVEKVSWNDAAEFCAKLSQNEKLKPFYFRAAENITPLQGTGYRLPSEAEWEFACRAGTNTKYWFGDQEKDLVPAGWFGGNSGYRSHPVGELKANPFGLFDIHGNVSEWVEDGWDPAWYGQHQDKPAIAPVCDRLMHSWRVLRGGGCAQVAFPCASSRRGALAQREPSFIAGFRVALPVDAVRESLSARVPAVANYSLEEYFARNRLAAEHALALDGEVVVEITKPSPEWRTLKAGDSLPEQDFVVRMWSIKNSKTATSGGLDVLAGVRHVHTLNLSAPGRLDAEVIPKIAALRSPVKELSIGHCNLKTSALDRLPVMPHVHLLWLTSEQVDDGWRFLKRFPALRTIELYGAPLPDLGPLSDVPHLRLVRLVAWGEPPDAAKIRDIQKRNAQFRILFQAGDELKALGIDPGQIAARRLIEAGIPLELIDAQGLRKQLKLDDVDRTVAMYYLAPAIPREVALTEELRSLLTHVVLQAFKAEGQRDADSLAKLLSTRPEIDHLMLTDSDLTDEGLRHLSRLSGLRGLNVHGTQVTAAGVADFHRAVPSCVIQSATGDINPDYSDSGSAKP